MKSPKEDYIAFITKTERNSKDFNQQKVLNRVVTYDGNLCQLNRSSGLKESPIDGRPFGRFYAITLAGKIFPRAFNQQNMDRLH